MPNGRPYESPLNKLADALPNFILQMQDIKVRQDYYEALADYRTKALAAKIETDRVAREVREAIETERNLRGYYDPPEVKSLRDNISYNLRVLDDPNVSLTLGDDEIVKRWKNVKNQQADYFGRTGRDISVSMPVTVEEALGREKEARKPEVHAAGKPSKSKKIKGKPFPAPKLGETEAGYRRRTEGAILPIAEGLGLGELTPLTDGAVAGQIKIPEGAQTTTGPKGTLYLVPGESVWRSAITGEPVQ